MNVQTMPTLASRINSHLDGPVPDNPAERATLADMFRVLPMDQRIALFQQLRVRQIKGEFAQRRFVQLLFAFGNHLQWQQPNMFNHLKHSWERNTAEAGYADMMARCLRELVFMTR